MSQSSSSIGATGFAARVCHDDNRQTLCADVLQQMTAAGIETLRLSFVDQHGVLRGKTLVADMAASAMENGCNMTTTLLLKDTAHKTVYPVWQKGGGMNRREMTGASDFVMLPDPATFKILPWANKSAWMLCDCYFPNGEPVPFSTRQLAQQSLQRLSDAGYDYLAGLELEFYVYRLDDAKLAAAQCGQPGAAPEVSMLAQGFQYLTENRYDQLEPVFDELRQVLQQLNLPVRTLESEFGPSQCEITFAPVKGLAAADNVVLARSAIKQFCRRKGLLATFMCRPGLPNAFSNGWHLHQSLVDPATGANCFQSEGSSEPLSELGRHYVGGLLEHAYESCIFATPTINGYKRYRPYSLAPKQIVWGQDNRGAMIRVIGQPGDPAAHIENRVGESAANPYLYFMSQIETGLAGIQQQINPVDAVDAPYDDSAKTLPDNLLEAVDAFSHSDFWRQRLGEFVDYYSTIKRAELHRFLAEEVTDWEQREYFDLF